MTNLLGGALRVRGEVGRTKSNALTMTFSTGPDAVVAEARQSGADGKGRKFGVLLGFLNGGPGTHVLTGADGTVLHVHTRDGEPSSFTTADGTAIGEAVRAETTDVRDGAGATVFTVVEHPEGGKTLEAFRMQLRDPAGAIFGDLDVVRTVAGWSLGQDLIDATIWWGRAGQPLKIPMLGTRLAFTRPPTAEEGNLALCACVDMAIGLRPYVKAMQ